MNTLLILHGWQSSKEKWATVKKEIESQEISVIIPDLPGFKTESELKKPWNLDDYVGWLKDFTEEVYPELGEGFFLLGHSFGGRVAIKFAVKYPEGLKGLILVSAAGIRHQPSFWQRQIKAIAFLTRRFSFLPGYDFFRKIIYKFVLRKTDYLMTEGVLKETFKNIIGEDLTPVLSKIKVPTLIIWGKKDKMTPLSDAYLMKEKIENSKLEILDRMGHAPYLENPEYLSQKIMNFIR